MKILLFNGSPREGNTKFAIDTVKKSIDENMSGVETDIVELGNKDVHACIGCNTCIENGGICVFDDDMTDIIAKVRDADMIIFGSPVYWWGITAQLKTVIDRMYALIGDPGKTEKQIGLVITGQDSLDGPQYGLISKQFECIAEHLNWDMAFDEAISADGPQDIKNDEKETANLKDLWKNIKA